MMTHDDLRELLERLHNKYNRPEFIEDDPVSIPHRYAARGDREIAGFLAATIAWGNRKAILKSARRMMTLMDDAPHDFVVNASQAELARLAEFVHRTFNGGDLLTFVRSLRRLEEKHGGIGRFFESVWERTGDMRQTLAAFHDEFFALDHLPRCRKHVSSVASGAACKRLNMYLRWMVRCDGRGVDFGLWETIPPSALMLPLDVHAGNMGRALGLLARRQNDWKAVEEITAALRSYDPNDPVRYDFALFGAGVDGYLK